MYFIYTNTNLKIQGDITVIPNKYRDYALQQKNKAITADNIHYYCPPMIVDINISIQYIV